MSRFAITLLGLMLLNTPVIANTTSLSKNSPQLKSLGNSWKVQKSIHLKQDAHDITMVYGGADISRRPTLVTHQATV